MNLTLIVVLLIGAFLMWWLSGFDSKLTGENNASAHSVYCRNILRARKTIDAISKNPAFSEEQVALANARFKEWKAQSGAIH